MSPSIGIKRASSYDDDRRFMSHKNGTLHNDYASVPFNWPAVKDCGICEKRLNIPRCYFFFSRSRSKAFSLASIFSPLSYLTLWGQPQNGREQDWSRWLPLASSVRSWIPYAQNEIKRSYIMSIATIPLHVATYVHLWSLITNNYKFGFDNQLQKGSFFNVLVFAVGLRTRHPFFKRPPRPEVQHRYRERDEIRVRMDGLVTRQQNCSLWIDSVLCNNDVMKMKKHTFGCTSPSYWEIPQQQHFFPSSFISSSCRTFAHSCQRLGH
jgi:hypothetical protein